jgi:hypothetical protein
MGVNFLKVNYKLGREVAAEMSVVGFEVPVMNPQTRNKRHKVDAGADDMWWRWSRWKEYCIRILEYGRCDILLVIFD